MRLSRILVLALASLSLLTALSACSSAPSTPPEKFTLAGQAVEFSPPPAAWSKSTQQIPKSWDLANQAAGPDAPAARKVRELPGGDLVRFTPPWPDGHLTVSALAGWELKSWAEDPEKTRAHVEHLQSQVLKRTGGQILKQSETKLGGEVALRLDFRYMEGPVEMKGAQVHALHQGVYWSLGLLGPAEHHGEALPLFNALVDSFKFQ